MKVLVSDPLAIEGLDILRKGAEVIEQRFESQDELIKAIGEYDALVVRSGTQVTAEVIDAGKKLKVIGRAGVGVDNIDVLRATEKGIMVINAPEGNTISAAEHTIAMLTSVARNISEANASVKKGEWKRSSFLGVELYNKTLGVVGLGRIGSEVARRSRAMGMKILAYDPYISVEQAEKIGAKMAPLNDVIAQSDFITLHLPMSKASYHLIGEEQFNLMKDGVRIINCARGGLIDEQALCNAIALGKVAGAALDVFEMEPPLECPLLAQENVIVTPHLGASTKEAQINVAIQVAEQIVKALHGDPIVSAVNVPVILPEDMAEVKYYLPLMKLLGNFYMQVFGGSVEEIEIRYSGEIAQKPLASLTNSCLIGILQVMVGSQVNFVNAAHIAKSRGIKIKEMSTKTSDYFSNLVTLSVKSEGKTGVISGTLFNHNDIRIVQIGDFRLEVVPSRYMLICNYSDIPGIIGKAATILGNNGINIASMQVGRKTAGGDAVMVLQVDETIPSKVLKEISKVKSVSDIHFVVFPERMLLEQ